MRIKYIQKTVNDEGISGYAVYCGFKGQKPDFCRKFFGEDAKDSARSCYQEIT